MDDSVKPQQDNFIAQTARPPWPHYPEEVASYERGVLHEKRKQAGLCPECERPFVREKLTPRRVSTWDFSGLEFLGECEHVCDKRPSQDCPTCGRASGWSCNEEGGDCAGRS